MMDESNMILYILIATVINLRAPVVKQNRYTQTDVVIYAADKLSER